MTKIILVSLVVFSTAVFSQFKEIESFKLKSSEPNKEDVLKSSFTNLDSSISKTEKKTLTSGRKSPGLAFLYSLVVPGLGQTYLKRFDVGKYYLISEAALWLTYAAFTIYGNWQLKDAYNYAEIHAGINQDGKDDDFFVNVGIYDNVDQYNNERLIFGEYEKIYDPANGYGFYWDNSDNRKRYRADKLSGDRIINDRLFIFGVVLLNHVVSAVSALFMANSYNSDLKSGGFKMEADVTKHFNRVDGLKLKLTKWF